MSNVKIEDKVGAVRIKNLIHPDSIGVMIWEVEQVTLSTGKYSETGDTYWKRMSPDTGSLVHEGFTCKQEAKAFADSINIKELV